MNPKQKYKAIFGLDFLCANGIDFILSKKMIEWEGVRIPLECYVGHRSKASNKTEITDNSYTPMTVVQIINHKNQEHLSGELKEQLTK